MSFLVRYRVRELRSLDILDEILSRVLHLHKPLTSSPEDNVVGSYPLPDTRRNLSYIILLCLICWILNLG